MSASEKTATASTATASTSHRKRAGAAALATLVLLASLPSLTHCSRDERVGKTSTTGAKLITDRNDAATTIATARCMRASRCNEIGDTQRWASDQACLVDLKTRLAGDLTESSCPRGVSKNDVDECARSIRNEACPTAFETFERFPACRTTALCL
jgi:hypothetical protein